MRKLVSRRPSPAAVLAFVALVAALSGSAIALPGSNGVNSGDIKNNSVRSKDVRNNNLTGKDIKNLRGGDINEGSLGKVPSATSADNATNATNAQNAQNAGVAATLAGHHRIALKRVQPVTGDNEDAAREAAQPQVLATVGPFTIYAKCYIETDATDSIQAVTFISTTESGSILDADNSTLFGFPDFLDTNTEEEDREITRTFTVENATEVYLDYGQFGAIAPGGTTIDGRLGMAVKFGDPGGGNGAYGAGNVCLFTGQVTQL